MAKAKRKRDKKGHFVKATTRKAAKRKPAKKASTVRAKARKRVRNHAPGVQRQPTRAQMQVAPATVKIVHVGGGKKKRKGKSRRRYPIVRSSPSRKAVRSVRAKGAGRVYAGGRSVPGKVNVSIRLDQAKRPAARKGKGRKGSRRHPATMTLSRGVGAGRHSVGDYALANPLSAGEFALLGFSGIIGYGLSDFLGRYLATSAPPVAGAAPVAGALGNDTVTLGWPGWKQIAAQGVATVLPVVASGFVASPWGRAALQGVAIGAGGALFGNLFTNLMAYLLSSQPIGQQLYLAQIDAQQAQTLAAQQAAGTTAPSAPTAPAPAPSPAPAPTGQAGLPRGVGARPQLRDPSARLALGIGAGRPAAAGVGACEPCLADPRPGQVQAAAEAARTGMGHAPSGFTMFPE